MDIERLDIDGLFLIKPEVYRDRRGFFLESYRKEDFFKAFGVDFLQDNHSFSVKGTIRGFHFQEGGREKKLIRVISGKIFDVAVDIRRDSGSFGEWRGVFLDDVDCNMFFISEGFAHGFCVLSEGAHVVYKTSSYFEEKKERGFSLFGLGIDWPSRDPVLSDKDMKAPSFQELFL